MTHRWIARGPGRVLFLTLATMLGSLLAARFVQAQIGVHVDQQLLELSRTFEGLLQQSQSAARASHKTNGASHVVRFNGIVIRAETRRLVASSAELGALFSALRAQCQVPLGAAPAARHEVAWGAPILENSNSAESYLYCLRPHTTTTFANMSSLAQNFATSLDLAQLGQVFGLYARSHDNEHQLLLVQLDGAVDLDRAFSRERDAPGRDFPDILRPAGRRSASLSLNDAPALNVYQLPDDSIFALDGYAQSLKQAGLSVTQPRPDGSGSAQSLVARSQANTYLIVRHPNVGQRARARLSVTRIME